MNVLITSAGRRTSLARTFKEAVTKRDGKLVAGDMDPLAPALYLADLAVRLPRALDNEYIPALLDIVKRYAIRLIVPTIDTELASLAASRHLFAEHNCLVHVSSPELVGISGDKWLTVNRYRELGIRTPASWLPDDMKLDVMPEQLFIKPRDGSASKDAFPVEKANLNAMVRRVPNPIVQERLIGTEITIDALLDLNGKPIHYVPRKRIKTVGGESIQGVTIDDSDFRTWMISVLEATSKLGGVGAITLQAFMTESGLVLSEINPRFGGGYPLALAAGGSYPEWLLQMLESKDIQPCFGEYKVGLHMTRFYNELFFEKPVI